MKTLRKTKKKLSLKRRLTSAVGRFNRPAPCWARKKILFWSHSKEILYFEIRENPKKEAPLSHFFHSSPSSEHPFFNFPLKYSFELTLRNSSKHNLITFNFSINSSHLLVFLHETNFTIRHFQSFLSLRYTYCGCTYTCPRS